MVDENVNGVVEEKNNPMENVEVVEETFKETDDNDEKILIEICKKRIYEVTTTDLLSAGFNNPLRIKAYEFRVGQFLLSRLDTSKPYTIEKI